MVLDFIIIILVMESRLHALRRKDRRWGIGSATLLPVHRCLVPPLPTVGWATLLCPANDDNHTRLWLRPQCLRSWGKRHAKVGHLGHGAASQQLTDSAQLQCLSFPSHKIEKKMEAPSKGHSGSEQILRVRNRSPQFCLLTKEASKTERCGVC